MTRRRWAVVAALMTAVLSLAACGSAGPGPDPQLPVVVRAQGVARLLPAADAPVGAVATGMTGLAYRLGQHEPGNWVVSPASLAYAFAMVRAGANGTTAAELDQAFGFPASGLGDAFNSITREVITDQTPPPAPTAKRKQGEIRPTVMCLANALFPQSGYPIGADFLRTLAEQYDAGVYPLDFGQAAAKNGIDAWVRQQTAGRVPKLFDSLAPDTKLVLANTVYLRADWQQPFGEIPTADAPFRRADGSSVNVPMMHLAAGLRYAAGPGWQAVELPYRGGELALRLLVPTGATSPNDLLAPEVMAAVSARLTSTGVQVSMPTWDMSTSLELVDALRALGVKAAFDDTADFSGIHQGLYIDQAIHRANITVDEAGTEAAAATGISMRETAGMVAQATVVADHPFAFAIVHVPTGVPVFVGHVADPSARTS